MALRIPFNDVRDTPGWFENIRPIDVPMTTLEPAEPSLVQFTDDQLSNLF